MPRDEYGVPCEQENQINNNTSIQSYSNKELKEYFIATIQDVDDDETQIWNSKPYSLEINNLNDKREFEKENSLVELKVIAEYIMMTNERTANPYIYDIGDGNQLEVKFLNLYLIQSYYPPEIVNANFVKREWCGDWRFWNGQLGQNGQVDYNK